MPPALRPTRTLATLSAALLLGAGGGAGAALAIDDGGSSSAPVANTTQGGIAAPASPDGALTVNGIYRRARQGVVDITVDSGSGSAEGSGFVLDDDGNIVTNQHVVDGGTSIQVKFADGTRADATVVGSDASSDIAVVHVSGVAASKLHPLSLADSSKSQVGNSVIAIGSPYGLDGSLTAGVISATGRTITSPNHYTISGAIQTDAPINHGNSGGPLLDGQGNVVGVNAQIESDNGENTGVGFAIPSNTVKTVARQIVSGDQVRHPFLGVQLTDGDAGATVADVTSGGPAEDAGLRRGDVVTAVDGQAVSSADDLVTAIQAHPVGDKVTLTVSRDGASSKIQVTLGNQAASAS